MSNTNMDLASLQFLSWAVNVSAQATCEKHTKFVRLYLDPSDTNGGMTVYYLQRRGDNQTEKLHAFPQGFRMVAGDPFTRTYDGSLAAQGISFNCLGANKPETNGFPDIPCPGGMRAQVYFPQCWDGVNLDSVDHKSHMSYPDGNVYNGGNCPSSHPVHMVSIFFELLYDTALFSDQWVDGQNPFVFAQGDATGLGFHGDFFNGWDVDVLQEAIDTCADNSGRVDDCAAVTMFTDQECNDCKLPTSVNESTSQRVESLPHSLAATPSPMVQSASHQEPALELHQHLVPAALPTTST